MKTVKKYKICRRLGSGVFAKCQTAKFTMSEARHAKGKKGKRGKPLSSFGTQFIEKQKVRFTYGISEKQFSNLIKEAVAHKGGLATDTLFELLERRLDNVVFRMGLAHTRRLARQMVSHGHITVNGIKSTIPSQRVKIGDVISVREGSKGSTLFVELDKKLKDYITPKWLKFDAKELKGNIEGKTETADEYLDLNTVLEFYSR